MKNRIISQIESSIEVKKKCLTTDVIRAIENIAECVIKALKNGNKILLFGNGGSASDAQHIAAELTGRFETERKPLPAIALACNISSFSAIGNDYGFEDVFSRQLEALGQSEDVAIGITTSGSSKNVIKALQKAKEKNMLTAGFTGIRKGLIDETCSYVIHVPSDKTALIQECHIMSGHIICRLIDDAFKS